MLVDTDPPVLATVTRVLSRALFPLVITCGPFDLVSRTWLCCYVRTHHKKPVAVQKCIPLFNKSPFMMSGRLIIIVVFMMSHWRHYLMATTIKPIVIVHISVCSVSKSMCKILVIHILTLVLATYETYIALFSKTLGNATLIITLKCDDYCSWVHNALLLRCTLLNMSYHNFLMDCC